MIPLSGRRQVVRPALAGFGVLCRAGWVLVEDMGIFSGLGTDPNSMIPMALLAAGAYLALTRVPAAVPATAETALATAEPAEGTPETIGAGLGSPVPAGMAGAIPFAHPDLGLTLIRPARKDAADYLTAAICTLTGNQPSTACTAAIRALERNL